MLASLAGITLAKIEAMMVIPISIPTSPTGTLNLAPSSSLEISRKISHDWSIPRHIPTNIPNRVMNEDSIKNWVRIILDLNPMARRTPMDCLLSTTALTDKTPIAATPTTNPKPLNPWTVSYTHLTLPTNREV